MMLPEPQWESIKTEIADDGSRQITDRVDRDAKRIVIQNLGRKWTRRHDVAYVAFMVKNGYLPAHALEQAREELQDEKLKARQIRKESGLPPNHGFRITS